MSKKNGYEQLAFKWSDDTYKYEVRWHTRTPNAPEGQGSTCLLYTSIENIYGDAVFHSGDLLRGNFYKCGDRTEHPHYASFTKIDTPRPCFMDPDYFADMIIVD